MQAKSLLTEKIHIIVSSVYKSNLQGTTLIMLSAHLIYFWEIQEIGSFYSLLFQKHLLNDHSFA